MTDRPRDKPPIFGSKWITENSKKVLTEYYEGITLRQLYYRLVALGMTNDLKHYKKVIYAMTQARWEGIVGMESFVDRERAMEGETAAKERSVEGEVVKAKDAIRSWMNYYCLDRWSNQDNYVEVWIEKKALQGVFESPCRGMNVGLAPCKGYPSITFLNEARGRYDEISAMGKNIIILYFGDYDPSGEDIPRSIQVNLERMGCEIEIKRVALNPEQIRELNLPSVPPKITDARTANWNGRGVVELDAVEPKTLQKMCSTAIEEQFDREKYAKLQERQDVEEREYKKHLIEFVIKVSEGDDDE